MKRPPRTFVSEKRLRINDRIRNAEVRVIDEEGNQLGVMPTEVARQRAAELEVDLVEVSPMAVPPVCKLMNFGKFMYQAKKKAQDAKRHQTKTEVKEVKFRPKIDEHDYNFKKNHVVRFLDQGDKVKCTIMFRGREIVHVDYGRHILLRLIKDLAEQASVELEPKLEGKTLSMILAARRSSAGPKSAGKPKKSPDEGKVAQPRVAKDENAKNEDEPRSGEAVSQDG